MDACLREPGFKYWATASILHCSSSLRCMSEYLATDIGGYLCTNSLRALIVVYLDASREVKMGSVRK